MFAARFTTNQMIPESLKGTIIVKTHGTWFDAPTCIFLNGERIGDSHNNSLDAKRQAELLLVIDYPNFGPGD